MNKTDSASAAGILFLFSLTSLCCPRRKRLSCLYISVNIDINLTEFEARKSSLCFHKNKMVGGERQRPQFVLFGSSIVQLSFSNEGWGAILADLYARKADILLRGYNGWNSRRGLQVLDQIFPKDAAVQPALVIVYFGGNDSMSPHPTGLGPHVPLPEYVENMRNIAIHLKSLSPKTRIIFLSAPPINEQQIRERLSEKLGDIVRTNENCRIYSEACVQLCREMDVKCIDLWTAMQQQDDWLTTCFIDGIHFSSEGSKIVVKEIMKVLREADWEPSLHWKSLPTEFAEDSIYYPVAPNGKTTINVSDFDNDRHLEWE